MRPGRTTLLAIALALLAPASASAATTIGSTMPAHEGEALECTHPAGCTFVARTIAGTPVVVPHDGILAAWSAVLPSPDSGPVEMVVLRPSGDGAARVGGTALSPSPYAGSSNNPSANIPVKAGDLIGVELDHGEGIGIASHPGTESTSWWFEPRLTTARAPDLAETDDFQALFSATIQLDTDRNGQGDDNQRFCQRPGGCTVRPTITASVDPKTVLVGDRIRLQATVVGPGLRAEPDATFTVRTSSHFTPVRASGRGPCTLSERQVTCPLGKVAIAERIAIDVELQAREPGGATIFAELGTAGLRIFPHGTGGGVRVLATGPCSNALSFPTFAGDRLSGGSRANTITGLAGDDCLLGGGGDDLLTGGEGNDRLDGGTGRDVLRGEAGNDHLTGGPWKDRLDGGLGDDRLEAVDRKRDIVRCGPGRDRARVDAVDSVAGCEGVKRVSAAKRRKR